MLIAVIILSIIILVLLVALRNLLIKVEKYEDITVEQADYMNNISNLVKDSQKPLKNLDERGVFQSDDEVGYFFDNLKKVQENFDQYQLSDNYAPKKIQS